MQRHLPVEEGARIYNLFPLLAGSMDQWPAHMRRARDMEFNWVFINPFHFPGFSGSLYSIKDYYRIHPLLSAGLSRRKSMEQLREIVQEAQEMGLHLMMDLVINHTAVDSPLISQHPKWFCWNKDGTVVNPSVWEGDKLVAVWGDLAEIDNARSRDRDHLWKYWVDLTLFYRDMGFAGFRCDAAYQVTAELWEMLIHKVKKTYPETFFFAETLGCEIEDVVKLAKAGFDYTFNSSKYWDFEEEWCLSQYRKNASWAPSVSFAESHDTERLYEELQGDLAAVRQRYLFSALFSTGVLMPVGFEFGFRKRLHVVNTRSTDWEEEHVDLTDFIRAVNRIKKNHPVFNEDGPIEIVDVGNSDVLGFKKRTFDGLECALILINKDRERSQSINIPSPATLLPGVSAIQDITPEFSMPRLKGGGRDHLPPSGYRVLYLGPNR
jgi:starch synthase (maltosyl-transferring)